MKARSLMTKLINTRLIISLYVLCILGLNFMSCSQVKTASPPEAESSLEIKARVKTKLSRPHTGGVSRGELLAYQCSTEHLKTLGLDGQVVHSIPNPGVPCTDPIRIAIHPKTGNVLVTDGGQLWRVIPYPKLSAERVTTLDFSGCFPKIDAAPAAQATDPTAAQISVRGQSAARDESQTEGSEEEKTENQGEEETEERSVQADTSRDPEHSNGSTDTEVSESSGDPKDSGDPEDSEDTDELEYPEDEFEERRIAEEIEEKESAIKFKLYVSKTEPHVICIQSEYKTGVVKSAFNAETSALTYQTIDDFDSPMEDDDGEMEGGDPDSREEATPDLSERAAPASPEEANSLCGASIPACAHVPEDPHEAHEFDSLSLDEMISADRDPTLASRYTNLEKLCDPSVDQSSLFTHLEDQPQEKCVIHAGSSKLFGVSPSGRYITILTNLGIGCQYVSFAVTIYNVDAQPKRRVMTWLSFEDGLISSYQQNKANLGWSPYADALAIGSRIILFPKTGTPRLLEFEDKKTQ